MMTSSHKPGDTFDIGITNVSYVVHDEAGNYNGCSFQVVIIGKSSLNIFTNYNDFQFAVTNLLNDLSKVNVPACLHRCEISLTSPLT